MTVSGNYPGHPSPAVMVLSRSERKVLSRHLADYRDPEGRDLLARCAPLEEWLVESDALGLLTGERDLAGQASHDCLGLSSHPTVQAAASPAVKTLTRHPPEAIEPRLSDLLGFEHIVLFPSGWAAGFGAIRGLVRPYDHVVIDALAHDCLRQGARTATTHVHQFAHNDMASLDACLGRIRSAAPAAAILVVTESLFAVDSSHPDFPDLVDVCRRHHASSLVDVALDLGCCGPGGTGLLIESGVSAEVDIVVGSFSKVLAANGGFCATHSRPAALAVRSYSGTYGWSTPLSTSHRAIVAAALDVVRSPEGEARRQMMLERARALRQALVSEGVPTLGRTSPLVVALVGGEAVARLTARTCAEYGVPIDVVEFPDCPRGQARLVVRVTAQDEEHTLRQRAGIIADAVRAARTILQSYS